MKRLALFVFAALGLAAQTLRPPAVPLVANDPYFSVWSTADRLNEDSTRHWTGTPQTLTSLVRIDGKAYRLMGAAPREVPPAKQTRVEVLPTRTIYDFEADGVQIELTFLTPALPDNLDVLSRPVTYIEWSLKSLNGSPHSAAVYFDAAADLAVNTPEQSVTAGRVKVGNLRVLRLGSQEQPVLQKWGDNLRIDWGYLYTAAPSSQSVDDVVSDGNTARRAFAAGKRLPDADDLNFPRMARAATPALVYAFDLGQVSAAPASRFIALAYDDQFSIEYLQRRLRPYWRRNGMNAAELLMAAVAEYPALKEKSAAFDREMMSDLERLGGRKYALLSALAYRQAFAAHKLAVDADGTPMFFPKENFSNGCIGTVDVFYPSAPLFLLVNPELLKASMAPILQYASMENRWRFPFAPHDVGTYPLANGQVYGGGEKTEENQMPVEESANMLILAAAVAHTEGNAGYASQFWPVLTKWAEYLKEKGLDPENQLCTDDFAGHLAHNANLSLKAIVALGSYGKLCEMTGRKREAAEYGKLAQAFSKKWIEMAADGDHYKLAFDKPGTWSQKYNLVWDKLLGMGLFPAEVAQREIAYYKTKQNRYGLPLDNRQAYTKLDWVVWTATLAGSQADFQALVDPLFDFANDSPSRVPLTDWFWTTDAKQRGFQARSVVGGVFIKMLSDPQTWKKWSSKAK